MVRVTIYDESWHIEELAMDALMLATMFEPGEALREAVTYARAGIPTVNAGGCELYVDLREREIRYA